MFDKTNELYYYKYNKNRITSQGAYAQMEVKTMLTDMGTILRQAKERRIWSCRSKRMEFKYSKEYFEAASELKAPVIIDGAGIHQIEEISDAVIFMKRNFQK